MSGIYSLKPAFVARLRRAENVLVAHRVSPNAITLSAVLVSAMAGVAIVAGERQALLWLALLPLGVIRLALNALDGSVARRRHISTPRGAAFNELGDRACDLALFGPLLAIVPAWLVVIAIAAMTLTSTAGVMALAVTGERDTCGPMGKADRVILLGLAALIAALIDSPVPFQIALVVVIGGCVVTTFTRLRRLPKEARDVR